MPRGSKPTVRTASNEKHGNTNSLTPRSDLLVVRNVLESLDLSITAFVTKETGTPFKRDKNRTASQRKSCLSTCKSSAQLLELRTNLLAQVASPPTATEENPQDITMASLSASAPRVAGPRTTRSEHC